LKLGAIMTRFALHDVAGNLKFGHITVLSHGIRTIAASLIEIVFINLLGTNYAQLYIIRIHQSNILPPLLSV
jgi:hypothetical protein